MRLGGIYIDIGAKTSQLVRDLKKAEGIVAKSAVLMKQELGKISFKDLSIAVAAFSAASVFGMKKAIDAASDLQEVTSKFGVVFKDQIDLAEKNSKILVDSYGLSTREAKQYLSSVQDLLVPMGMASNAAAKMSNEVVKLSVDLGSFNNLPTEQVMMDMQSALVGNFETMKKYGVVLNEKVVQQEAFNLGLIKTKDELNANIKAQAAYSLMVKGSAAAIGDWARTQGGYANQMKELKKNIEEMSAAIGNKLLPIVTEWLVEANKWFRDNDRIIDQIGDFAEIMLNLASTLGKATAKVVEFFNIWVNTWQALGLATGGQITLNEALTNGAEAVERFNRGLNERSKLFKIGPQTKGWEDYSQPPPPDMPPPPSPGGDITGADAERQAALATAYAYDEALLQGYYDVTEELRARELERELAFIEEKKTMWEELRAYDIEKAGEYDEALIEGTIATNEALLDEHKRHEDAKLEWTRRNHELTLAVTGNIFNNLMKLSQGHSKKIFEVMKVASIANAIVSTYAGAANALRDVPYPYNFVAAASVIAYGMAQVQQIRAQTFSSGGHGGHGGHGGSSGGDYVSPTGEIPDIDDSEKRGSLTINIQGDMIGDEAYIEMLAEKISEAVEDRDIRLVSSNSREAEALA